MTALCARCGARFNLDMPRVRPLCPACLGLLQHAVSDPRPLTEQMAEAMGYKSGSRIAGNN